MNSTGLLSSGFSRVIHNKRYISWFWLLNLTLAEFGTAAFRRTAHAILDHSLYSERLVNGFDRGVLTEFLARPEFGSMHSMRLPALYFGFVFFLATAVFLPGIFTGYASTYRLPREEFFRACGRNLWRFIWIIIIAAIVMSTLARLLYAANDAIIRTLAESTNEKLPFELELAGLIVIFLVMTILRTWFDLAEVETVLNDEPDVRKSIAMALHHTFNGLPRLLASYVIVTVAALILLAGGLWVWMRFVSPENVLGAFAVAQITLFLLLVPRFWQRGIAVSYWEQCMLPPMVPMAALEPSPIVAASAAVAPVANSGSTTPATQTKETH